MIAETSAIRIYGLALGLVTLTLTARILGPEGRGILAAITTWSAFLALFAGLSLGEVSQHRIQQLKGKDWLPSLLGAQLFFVCVLGLLAVGGMLVAYWATDGALIRNVPFLFVLMGLVLIPFQIWDNFARYLLVGADRLRDYNRIHFWGSTASFLLILFFLIYLNMGILGVLLASMVAGILTNLAKIYVVWKAAGRRVRIDFGDVAAMLRGAFKLHFNAVGGILLIEANVLMLNHLGTPTEVGWFQLAFQMMMMMMIIPQSAQLTMFSKVAEVGPDKAWLEQRRLVVHLLALMTALGVAGYFLAPYVVWALAGPDFVPAVTVFRYLLLLLLALAFTLVLAPQWFGRGIFLPKSVITVLAGAINVWLNLQLIPVYGMMGAVAGVLISYIGVITVSQLVFVVWLEKKSGIFRRELVSPPAGNVE